MDDKVRNGLDSSRFEYLLDELMRFKEEFGDRLLESKNLLDEKVCLVDPHTHSGLSDGRGSVAQNYEVAMAAGLDFIYITDHDTIEQRRYAKMLEGISWGQEPTCGLHHIVLLNNQEVFVPGKTGIAELYAKASECSQFVFIPHAAGQGMPIAEKEACLAALRTIGKTFNMEIMNGLFRVFRSMDECDSICIDIWDQLLREGFRVTPLGASDAHEPFSIGTAFTGTFPQSINSEAINSALSSGECFCSEAPLLRFSCNNTPMGGAMTRESGDKLSFNIKVADSAGLSCVKIISDGRLIRAFDQLDSSTLEEKFTCFAPAKNSYFRLEVIAIDDRRAYSAPIYCQVRE